MKNYNNRNDRDEYLKNLVKNRSPGQASKIIDQEKQMEYIQRLIYALETTPEAYDYELLDLVF